ncbi:MAG TPA: hypothetical protein VIL24_02485 [Clostridia bacterium]
MNNYIKIGLSIIAFVASFALVLALFTDLVILYIIGGAVWGVLLLIVIIYHFVSQRKS